MTEGETVTNGTKGGEGDTNLDTSTLSEHDPHFEPIISLPEVVIPTLEEDEEEMIQLRAKLYRFDSSETPSEWKERGTGNVKLLRHKTSNAVRVVMRRDKTHKICANHFVTPWMVLSPNCGSDRAWVWSVPADLTYEKASPELLAIRFATAEQAQAWKAKFEEAKEIVAKRCSLYLFELLTDFCKEEGEEEDEENSADEEEEEEGGENSSVKEDDRLAKVEDEVTQKLKELEVTAEASSESKASNDSQVISSTSASEAAP